MKNQNTKEVVESTDSIPPEDDLKNYNNNTTLEIAQWIVSGILLALGVAAILNLIMNLIVILS